MRTNIFLTGILSLFLASCVSTGAETQPMKNQTSSSSSVSSIVAMKAQPQAAMKKQSSSAAAKSSVSADPYAAYANLTEDQWKAKLTADQYAVLRQGGTETPFTSALLDEHRKGTFYSVDCNEPVFRSEQKFDSGTGWPSFWAPISKGAVIERTDTSGGMVRTEVLSKCGGHLGHVFNDGPQPTGLRYCMNGLALKFVPDADQN